MPDRTVLISGAGIAGPTLAYWLQRAGFAPTIVEQAPALRTGGYVIDFWGLGYDIAERMGLIEAIKRAGYHARELRIVDDRGHRIAGFGTRVFDELTNGRYVTIARSGLSRLLFEAAESGTETIFGDEVSGLEQTAEDVQVCFQSGRVRRFDLVVGADGLHSRVRHLVFGPERQFEKHLGYAVGAFETSGYRPRDEDVYVMYGKPGRMLGRFTLKDDRALFLFVLANGGSPLLPQSLDMQKALLRETYRNDKWEVSHILQELDQTNELYFDSVSQIRMPAWSKGRVALIGDAAFCVSLLAGQGSALAMISAYALAGELAGASDHREAFAQYEARLRAYIAMKQKGAEMFAGAFAPRTPWGLWFRNQVIRAFAVPGVARVAVGREIADRLPLPDYPWRRRQEAPLPPGALH